MSFPPIGDPCGGIVKRADITLISVYTGSASMSRKRSQQRNVVLRVCRPQTPVDAWNGSSSPHDHVRAVLTGCFSNEKAGSGRSTSRDTQTPTGVAAPSPAGFRTFSMRTVEPVTTDTVFALGSVTKRSLPRSPSS